MAALCCAPAKRMLFAKAGCMVCFTSPNAVRKLLVLLTVLLTMAYNNIPGIAAYCTCRAPLGRSGRRMGFAEF